MCATRSRAIVTAMARTSITIDLDLELDEATDCPSGSARLPDGTSRDFHGWLGLAETIDSLVRAHSSVRPADRKPDTERN